MCGRVLVITIMKSISLKKSVHGLITLTSAFSVEDVTILLLGRTPTHCRYLVCRLNGGGGVVRINKNYVPGLTTRKVVLAE